MSVSTNTALLEYSHAHQFTYAYGCFHTVAELRGCNTDHMDGKDQNVYCLAPYRKGLPPLV